MSARFHILLLAALAALACGKEEPKPKAKPAPPAAPTFAGVEAVRNSPGSDSTLVINWRPAQDDYTPPGKLRYELLYWASDPRGAAAGDPATEDLTELTLGTCAPCAYRFDPPTKGTVWWFAVQVTDQDSEFGPGATGAGGGGGAGGQGGLGDHTAGADVVLPGAQRAPAPAFGDPWAEPTTVHVGDPVSVEGVSFLDEPARDDALKLNGVPVPLSAVREWGDRVVEFEVPEGATSGPVEINTLFGTATSTEPLQIEP